MADELLRHNQLALRAQWLLSRAQRGRGTRKVRAARRAFEEVLSVMAPDHPDRPACLNNLGVVLRMEFERTGRGEAVERLVAVNETITRSLPPRHPDRLMHQHNLRGLLSALAAGRDQPGLLAAVLPLAREAAVDPARYDVSGPLLARCLHAAYEENGEVAVLREAIAHLRALAVGRAVPAEHRWMFLDALGAGLRTLALRVDGRELLSEAVERGRQAVGLCPEGKAGRAGCLRNLGNSLHAWFLYGGGAPAVLREAEQYGRQALGTAPSGTVERSACLSALGIVLRTRYELTRELDVLREAVRVSREAVDGPVRDTPLLPRVLHNLSAADQEFFKRTGDVPALEEALDASRLAVRVTPANSPYRGPRLSDLGNALQLMAEVLYRPGPPGDEPAPLSARKVPILVEAVETARLAVAASESDTLRGGALSNLSIAARTLFELTGDRAALLEACAAAREAVALASARASSGVTARYALVLALSRREIDAATLNEMRRCCDSLTRGTAPPRTRAMAHRLLGKAAMTADPPRADLALSAYEEAVACLPELVPRHLLRADREFGLGELAGLPAEAASAALTLQRPERALLLLEHARGVLLREELGQDEGLEVLRRAEPALAEEFVLLRERLNAADRAGAHLYSGPHSFRVHSEKTEDHQELADRWDALLARIRALPGCAGFLLPPTPDALRRRAGNKPVVLVNPSPFRCDALILVADRPVRSVPLACDYLELRQCARGFQLSEQAAGAAPVSRSARDEQRLLAHLEWMWDRVCRPVLDALTPSDDPPHVRWCPVGVAAALPLHAAGRHGRPGAAVLDRVVSSYTSTVMALPLHAGRTGPAEQRLVVIEAAQAPGTRPLPGALLEARRLAALVPDAVTLAGPEATRAAVLAELPRYTVAHFACHAVTDPRSPSLSRLLLHDHHSAPLTVMELGALDVPHGALACLSACETSRGDERLVDEMVHIASAFQLAGYRQVVGTLWRVRDGDAGRVADDFHTALASSGDPESAALYLHHAVRGLRADTPDEPSRWAAHIHLGG